MFFSQHLCVGYLFLLQKKSVEKSVFRFVFKPKSVMLAAACTLHIPLRCRRRWSCIAVEDAELLGKMCNPAAREATPPTTF